jgi:hypothetical protein
MSCIPINRQQTLRDDVPIKTPLAASSAACLFNCSRESITQPLSGNLNVPANAEASVLGGH